MNNAEIKARFEESIDQYYKQLPYMRPKYREESELNYIGGILQAALHVLPNDMYFELKMYIYTNYGYDPGGCDIGQYSLNEIMEEYI